MGEIGICGCGGLSALWERSKPSMAMITVQIGFAGMNIISKIAISHGMSPFVVVFYRHLVATMVTAPLAFILERKTSPKLTWRVFCEIFISSFLGITLNQNFYYAGLKYTTATFAAAFLNLVPAITFLMAVIFGMERVEIRSLAGQAKVGGTLVCVSGAMIMTFFKGLKIQLWPSPFHLNEHNESNVKTEDLIKGSLFVMISCISFSAWFILQENITKKYPAQYSSTAILCFLVTIQSTIVILIFERGHYEVWALGWNVKLLNAIYSGVVASGIAFCLMTWCIKKKGPVFTTIFNPLMLIIVAFLGSILLDEKFHLGSVLGGILIVMGLYSVLWGKQKEMKRIVKMENATPSISWSRSTNMQQSEGVDNVEERETTKHNHAAEFQQRSLEEIITDSENKLSLISSSNELIIMQQSEGGDVEIEEREAIEERQSIDLGQSLEEIVTEDSENISTIQQEK